MANDRTRLDYVAQPDFWHQRDTLFFSSSAQQRRNPVTSQSRIWVDKVRLMHEDPFEIASKSLDMTDDSNY
jgi:hypothetical protein